MSKGSGLDSYKGLITPEQAAKGMNLAVRNARRLAVDAGLLLDLKSYPTAASLSALAIEECGKVSLLRQIALVTTESEAQKKWREYRNHRSKNGLWILPKLAKDGAIYLTQLNEAIDPKARHTAVLDGVKQIGFYTDCIGNAHWSDPESSIEEPLATGLVSIADRLSRMREVTIREMELWVEHLRPHYNTPQMAAALLQWHKVMIKEELIQESHEKFRDFVLGGGSVS